MHENRIAISADDRVLLDDGTAVVLHVDRAGIEVRDVRGESPRRVRGLGFVRQAAPAWR